MAKKPTLEQRAASDDLLAVVRSLRADSPTLTDPERKNSLWIADIG